MRQRGASEGGVGEDIWRNISVGAWLVHAPENNICSFPIFFANLQCEENCKYTNNRLIYLYINPDVFLKPIKKVIIE